MNPVVGRILLVGNDPQHVATVRGHLASSRGGRFSLEHSATLADALWRIESGEFDLVLLDLDLPDSAGLESVRRTRIHFPHVPVVVLTARRDDDLSLRALQAGAQDYLLTDQIDPELLTRSIRYAIERQRMLAELEQARQHEHYTATHDLLTGLPNRMLFEDRLERALEDSRRSGQSIAVLFLDLNRFKAANDTLGHSAGDRLIRMVAQRLAACVRSSDTLARRGGDEFTVVITRVTRPQDVTRVAQKMLDALEKPFVVDGFELRLGMSVGISLSPTDGKDSETLIKHADLAMYRAKARRASGYEFFRASMNHRTAERAELEASLRKGLERGEFTVRYQPQIDSRSGDVACMEALVRWKHPRLGTLRPSQFMNLANETGVVVPLGEWILREACRQGRRWLDAGYRPMPIAVNLSMRQLDEPGTDRLIRSILAETGLPGSLLELELTEGAVMRSPEATEATLRRLADAGVKIVLDNFGTGSSSLSQLRRLPLEKLKIGGQFIRTLEQEPDDQEIISAIVGLAQSLRLKPVAEGVETESQARILRALNCHLMQGYLFSKPVTAARAARFIEAPVSFGTMPFTLPDALRRVAAA